MSRHLLGRSRPPNYRLSLVRLADPLLQSCSHAHATGDQTCTSQLRRPQPLPCLVGSAWSLNRFQGLLWTRWTSRQHHKGDTIRGTPGNRCVWLGAPLRVVQMLPPRFGDVDLLSLSQVHHACNHAFFALPATGDDTQILPSPARAAGSEARSIVPGSQLL